MPQIKDGTIFIYTYKEGLLSKVAHDLRISAPAFSIEVEGPKVSVEIPAGELVVDGAMKKGQLHATTLSAKDKRDIGDNIAKDVLKTASFPMVRYRGEAAGAEESTFIVNGQLELRGQNQPLSLTMQRHEGRLRCRITIKPSLWGIKPFRALMGALKVQDRVEIALDIPTPKLLRGS